MTSLRWTHAIVAGAAGIVLIASVGFTLLAGDYRTALTIMAFALLGNLLGNAYGYQRGYTHGHQAGIIAGYAAALDYLQNPPVKDDTP